MNILFPFKGDSVGGSHISALLIVKNLDKNFNPIVLLHQDGELSKYLVQNNIPFIIDSKLKLYNSGIFSFFYSFYKYYKFFKIYNIKIVHTNEINMHLTWLFPCSLFKIKHLWHQRTPGPNKSMFLSFFSNQVVSVSSYSKKSFPSLISKGFKVLYDPFQINQSINKNLIFEKKTIELGWVGNLKFRRRFDVVIEIMKLLKSKDKLFKVHVFGTMTEPLISYYKNLINKYNLHSSFVFHGFENDPTNIYNQIDLLIATSENEAFGRTLVEAFSYKIPVLANNDGGHKEIIQNNITGYLISNNDPETYVSIITNLLNESTEYYNIVRNAHNRFQNEFTVKNHLDEMIKIYASL